MRYINVAPVLNIWSVRNMINSITIYGEAYFQYFKFIVPSYIMPYSLNVFDGILNTWDVTLLAML